MRANRKMGRTRRVRSPARSSRQDPGRLRPPALDGAFGKRKKPGGRPDERRGADRVPRRSRPSFPPYRSPDRTHKPCRRWNDLRQVAARVSTGSGSAHKSAAAGSADAPAGTCACRLAGAPAAAEGSLRGSCDGEGAGESAMKELQGVGNFPAGSAGTTDWGGRVGTNFPFFMSVSRVGPGQRSNLPPSLWRRAGALLL